ncbi:MAG TPA: putative glycolipid-binding domain-containing protein [Niastella sp.]
MPTNLLWTGIEYHSMENCVIDISATGLKATSTIIGYYDNKIYKVTYRIITNQNWQTVFLEVNSRHSNENRTMQFVGDGNGNWTNAGMKNDYLTGCIDLDISLTPFTNTLPIRRLGLKDNQAAEIKVIYCDILNNQIKPVLQRYTRISSTEYLYQNVVDDFEATIKVDESGLVVDYPALFTRTAAEFAR